MNVILLVLLVLLIFGGLGGVWYGPSAGWGMTHYGTGGVLWIILLVVIILALTGRL